MSNIEAYQHAFDETYSMYVLGMITRHEAITHLQIIMEEWDIPL